MVLNIDHQNVPKLQTQTRGEIFSNLRNDVSTVQRTTIVHLSARVEAVSNATEGTTPLSVTAKNQRLQNLLEQQLGRQ